MDHNPWQVTSIKNTVSLFAHLIRKLEIERQEQERMMSPERKFYNSLTMPTYVSFFFFLFSKESGFKVYLDDQCLGWPAPSGHRVQTLSSFIHETWGPTCKAVRKYNEWNHESESESHSVLSDALWPHGLYSPWNSPGQNTGVGSLSLLQGIFPTQRSNPGLPHCRRILHHWASRDAPTVMLSCS